MLRRGGVVVWARRGGFRPQQWVASISSFAKAVKKRSKTNFHVVQANEVRSPRCKGIPCNWPNPCPCFPMPSYASQTAASVKQDHTAALLSSASKERMYQLHKQDPETNNADKLAAEYRIRKQRVLAILWLKEMEKEEEAKRGGPLDDKFEKLFESLHTTYNKALRGEKHISEVEIEPENLNGKAADQALDELSAKEESMMVDEFTQRMEYHKKYLSGEIKDLKQPQRPDQGWDVSVELLDEKRGRTGGRRFISQPNGTLRTLNEIERMRVRREKILPRRKPRNILKPGSVGVLNSIDLPVSARQKILHLTLGELQGPDRATAYRIWHAIEDRPPGRVYVHPIKDKTVGRRVKAIPAIKAFRTRAVDRPEEQLPPEL